MKASLLACRNLPEEILLEAGPAVLRGSLLGLHASRIAAWSWHNHCKLRSSDYSGCRPDTCRHDNRPAETSPANFSDISNATHCEADL